MTAVAAAGRVELLRGEEPLRPPERMTWLGRDGHSAVVTVCLTQWRLLLFCPAAAPAAATGWLHSVPVTTLSSIEYHVRNDGAVPLLPAPTTLLRCTVRCTASRGCHVLAHGC